MWSEQLPELQKIRAVSLEALNQTALMSRVDQKFIFPFHMLNAILVELGKDYAVLEINGRRIFEYDSQYFDTESLQFYQDHHNGKPNRVKVRTRKYVDTGTAYFEVKRKIKGYITAKTRSLWISEQVAEPSEFDNLLQPAGISAESLKPTLEVAYHRITLNNPDLKERITIDLGLQFRMHNKQQSVPNTVIMEVKQEKIKRETPAIQLMRKHHIKPLRMSKYVMGMVMLGEVNKNNAFRFKINKIQDQNTRYGASGNAH